MEESFMAGTNDDFAALLDTRPQRVALSMLRSQKVKAMKRNQEQQSMILSEVAEQREKVTEAQWNYFVSALKQDQTSLQKDAYVRVTSVNKMDLMMGEVAKMKAADAGCSQDQIGVLSWADFNCPWARTKENSQSILRGMASLNEANPAGTAGLLIQPDSARDSSLRGLYDEERQLFDSLFSMSQSCETRFVEVFSRESKKAESKSNARKFGSGRLVTSSSLMDSNGWLASELAVYGRFVGANESSDSVAPLAILPKTASLLIPEPASPDPMIVSTACFDWDTVRIADRLRPSHEQVAAQKGVMRLEFLVSSVLKYTSFPAVLIVNLTGYVEELAIAVANMRCKKPTLVADCPMPSDKLYYLSVHTLDNMEGVKYGKSRVHRELLDMWLEKKFTYGGHGFNDQSEKAGIDCYKYMNDPASLELQVLVKSGSDFKIHPDQMRQWENAGHVIATKFAELKADHEKNFQPVLKNIIAASASVDREGPEAEAAVVPADGGGEGEDTELKSYGSVEELEKDDGPFVARCMSEIAGIEVIKGKSEKVYLVSVDKRRIVPKHTLLGGYQPVVPGEPLDEKQSVLLKWDLGDKTPIQIDMSSLNPDSTAMDVMTCYRYFTMLEKQKKATQYELSYSEVTRQVDASGDSFKIQLKSYDRVHGVTKLQKPYVMSRVALTLEQGKPLAT
ncbi:Uncharacterized protein SCF082_LOCUS24459 [Durusdinium trenchii]|uniref:Uncharacterized protein n=1 Tax=Durusdinium trenchii TaxID=1381693 RepID=A0ABP0LTG5_9DINO